MTHNINIYTHPSSLGGTGLFATTKITPGQLVLSIPEPLVTVPDDIHLTECCSRCMLWRPAGGGTSMLNLYEDERSLNYCTGCRVVKYCSKDCQRADWRALHKVECAIFKKLHPRILPGSVRATIRMLWTTPGEAWSQINSLESHESELRKTDKWEMITLMAKGAHGYSGTILGEKDVRGVYARLLINSITLVNSTFDPIGIAFDPLASLMNHSCDPNSVMVFDGRTVSVRALREIAKDEEITISYIDNTNPTSRRRSELQGRYFFTCSCQKCVSPATCSGLKEVFIDIPGVTTSNLEEYAWAAISTPSEDVLLKAIRALHTTKLWPLQRQPLPLLHHELIHSVYIPLSKWPQALLHSLLLYLYVDPKG
ncbi:uncharacterized protein LAJ45_06237 [Morchella importuna]|uniref:uncharacterized protein n=1 Tax=Morchella importuna TaxID=1174673 RepID=UPI001E8D7A2B|nr:uncharacterized protein LAJ45_06237 [Morchella importuna]KAH8149607.1 hypothetical protein LAJ45_06237 [Morchella importuna]